MAELTFRSPGVSTREIDLSSPSGVTPSGIPAAVIGTADRGPAFVPVTLATFQDFTAVFGATDGSKFGPLAMQEWLRNAGSGVYTRVLGIGNGQQRVASGDNAGKVTNAGFVAGAQLPQSNGIVARNTKAVSGNPNGRVHFLGCYMSETAGSTIFSSAGMQTTAAATPVIRGVLMAASGVVPMLSCSNGIASNTASQTAGVFGGFTTGSVNVSTAGRSSFTLLLNGHIPTSDYPNVITASFDPAAPNYFASILNRDPLKVESAGHLLYANYDIYSPLAVVTGTNIGNTAAQSNLQTQVGFILTGSAAANFGSTTVPNYEGFEDRFRNAFTPSIISQQFGGTAKNLFKIFALDDGTYPNGRFKVSIENIAASRDERTPYGTFDLVVRRFTDTDNDPAVLERFSQLSLDPNSDRYIARIIGDRHTYFDFDKSLSGQRLVTVGDYPNASNLIRVQIDSEVSDATIDATALPVGFRGVYHLVTSGSGFLATTGLSEATGISAARQPPVPMRKSVALNSGLKKTASNALYWGVQFEVNDSVVEPNRSSVHDTSLAAFATYFSNYHTNFLNPWIGDNEGAPLVNGAVVDADLFNNNLFTLERVQIVPQGTSDVADPQMWLSASYVRDGAAASAPYRYLNVAKDFGSLPNRQFIKFTTILHGGFDGTNVFDAAKSTLSNNAVVREVLDATQGGVNGPTVQAYRKAVDILSEQANADIQILAIPGIRDAAVTDYTISEIEDRFDAFYIMDPAYYDATNNLVTGSAQDVSVTYTANNFVSRALNTSFAAAYFPDVVMRNTQTNTNVIVPPSAVVLGAFALNDAIGFPWFAPAGFTRGALATTLESMVKLNRSNLDTLQDADLNPIVSFPGQAPVVFGQKTLLQAQSALDRVNVRRLLIDIRRRVKSVSNSFIFEPNRASTLARFQSAVQPIMQTIQAQRGVQKFKVVIDTSTTTQVDVENNTIRGKIFLQPTRSLEFVSLDFVVSNSGATT
jgi:phage tail sheath protein FI